MTLEPEDYVALNQPEPENPSAISFIQDRYKTLKRKLKSVGIGICATLLLTANFIQLAVGLHLLGECVENNYAPAYFAVYGLVGGTTKIIHLILRRTRRFPRKIQDILYPIYVFEFLWLWVGTYYYVLTSAGRHGCTEAAYKLNFWVIVFSFICLIFTLLVFSWVLTILFALVYFKNKIVQFLAKSIRF